MLIKGKDLNIKIGHNIKMLRTKNGLDQKSIADALDLSVPTFSRLERGAQPLTVCQALEICYFLGCNLSSIIDHELTGNDNENESLKTQLQSANNKVLWLQNQLIKYQGDKQKQE